MRSSGGGVLSSTSAAAAAGYGGVVADTGGRVARPSPAFQRYLLLYS